MTANKNTYEWLQRLEEITSKTSLPDINLGIFAVLVTICQVLIFTLEAITETRTETRKE